MRPVENVRNINLTARGILPCLFFFLNSDLSSYFTETGHSYILLLSWHSNDIINTHYSEAWSSLRKRETAGRVRASHTLAVNDTNLLLSRH